MKTLEIEKTKPTFIVSVLKVDIIKVGLVFSISNFFIAKTSLANNWRSFSSSYLALELEFLLSKTNYIFNYFKDFLEALNLLKNGPQIHNLTCSQLISSSNNKKILLTTRNVRLDSGHYATKYYYMFFEFAVTIAPSMDEKEK